MRNKEKWKGRRQFFANRMHVELFMLFVLASLIPTFTIAVFMFFLIFHITADQIGIPEAIAYHVIPAAQKVFSVLTVVLPLIIFIILFFAYKVTHRIVGPYDRIVRELDECISGERHGPIIIRDKDRFWPLVRQINLLLKKLKKS